MATYNSADWVVPQLESILSQTYKDFKLLVRDDGSVDNTLELVEAMARKDPRIVVLSDHGRNLGAKRNFGALLEESTADYVMFADADDVWLPQKVELTLDAMLKKEESEGSSTPILVHTDLSIVGSDLHIHAHSYWREVGLTLAQGRGLNRLLVQNSVTGCTMLLNRALVQLASPIHEHALMHDHWIALVASAFGEIVFLDQPTVLYRHHGENVTGLKPRYDRKYILRRSRHLLSSGISDLFENSPNGYEKTRKQAEAFLESYQHELIKHDINMLRDYVSLKQMRAVARRIAIVKHAFYRSGMARNIAWLFFV